MQTGWVDTLGNWEKTERRGDGHGTTSSSDQAQIQSDDQKKSGTSLGVTVVTLRRLELENTTELPPRVGKGPELALLNPVTRTTLNRHFPIIG